jgi:hypothetical protein
MVELYLHSLYDFMAWFAAITFSNLKIKAILSADTAILAPTPTLRQFIVMSTEADDRGRSQKVWHRVYLERC